MYAVIKTGGKQYRVKEGDLLAIEKLDAAQGDQILFDQVLLIEEDAGQVLIGTPVLESAAVKAEVIEAFKDDKVLVFKKKRRKQYRRTKGHRQQLLKVKIEKIFADTKSVPAEELKLKKAEPKPAAPAAEAVSPAKKAVKTVKNEQPAEKAEKKTRKPAAAKAPAAVKAAPKKKEAGAATARAKKAVKE